MDFYNYLQKLQKLPDKNKKIILWTIVAVLALAMAAFWLNSAKERFSKLELDSANFKLPQIELPQTEIIQ